MLCCARSIDQFLAPLKPEDKDDEKPTVVVTWGSSTVAAPSLDHAERLANTVSFTDLAYLCPERTGTTAPILQKRQLGFRQAKPHCLRGREKGALREGE